MSYTRVSYIRTNFTYFHTNLTANSNTKLELDFEIASFSGTANNCLFGNWNNGYNSTNTIIFNLYSTGYFRCYAGGYYNDNVSIYTIGNRYRNTLDGTSFVINNLTSSTSHTINIGRTVVANNLEIMLCAGDTYGGEPSDIKVYEAIIYDGDTVVGHYYPYKDNETGYGVLYDSVSNTYLQGATPSLVTAGDLLFGPDVDSLSFTSSGGNQTVTLTSNNPWTASTTESWIGLSQYSGTTGGTITVSVNQNVFINRTGTVEFSDGESSAPLIVTQEGVTVVPYNNIYRNGLRVN